MTTKTKNKNTHIIIPPDINERLNNYRKSCSGEDWNKQRDISSIVRKALTWYLEKEGF